MSERLNRLQERFRAAEAHADATKRAARQASAKRLQELLADPKPSVRLAGLTDPALTAHDRAQLELAIADELPSRRYRERWSFGRTIRGIMREVCYHPRALALIALIGVPTILAGGLAIRRTPPAGEPVSLSKEAIISWTMPSGVMQEERLSAGTALVLYRRDGRSYLKRWFPRTGYGEAEVDGPTIQTFLVSRSS